MDNKDALRDIAEVERYARAPSISKPAAGVWALVLVIATNTLSDVVAVEQDAIARLFVAIIGVAMYLGIAWVLMAVIGYIRRRRFPTLKETLYGGTLMTAIALFGQYYAPVARNSVADAVVELERERQAEIPAGPASVLAAAPAVETWESTFHRFFEIPENRFIQATDAQFDAWEAAMQEVVNETARAGVYLGDWDLMQEARDRVVQRMQSASVPPKRVPAPPPQGIDHSPWTSDPAPAPVVTESSGAASARRLEEQRAARGGPATGFLSWDEIKPAPGVPADRP